MENTKKPTLRQQLAVAAPQVPDWFVPVMPDRPEVPDYLHNWVRDNLSTAELTLYADYFDNEEGIWNDVAAERNGLTIPGYLKKKVADYDNNRVALAESARAWDKQCDRLKVAQWPWHYADMVLAHEQPQPVAHPNVTVAIDWLEKATNELIVQPQVKYEVEQALENLRLVARGEQPQPVAETPNRANALEKPLRDLIRCIRNGGELMWSYVDDAEKALQAHEQHAPQQPAGVPLGKEGLSLRLTGVLASLLMAQEAVDDDNTNAADAALCEAVDGIKAMLDHIKSL